MSQLVKKLPLGINSRAIVLPDTHGELVDPAALSCVTQAIDIIKPNIVIHLGDVGEWTSVNHHRHKRIRQPDVPTIAENIRDEVVLVANSVLDPIDAACARAGVERKLMLTGNHDRWLDYFVESNPDYARCVFEHDKSGELATGYNFKSIFDWKKRGWDVYPCGQLVKMGELHFYHGHLYGGVDHARQHLMKMGVNVVYGHWHDVVYRSITHHNGAKGAWSLGCLKSLNPEDNEWLENRPTNWGHCFAIVDWWGKSGYFTVHAINIIGGRCSLISTLLDGNAAPTAKKGR